MNGKEFRSLEEAIDYYKSLGYVERAHHGLADATALLIHPELGRATIYRIIRTTSATAGAIAFEHKPRRQENA